MKRRRHSHRRRNHIVRNIIIGCFVITLFLATGYSAFQTVISINAKGNIKKYKVNFDPNGGYIDINSKYVGTKYGDLPTPTREGYTFKGWNGKNLLNLDVKESFPSSTYHSKETKRTFIQNTYVLGLAYDNYYGHFDLIKSEFSNDNNIISFKTQSGYGIGFPLRSIDYQNYVLSYDISSTGTGGSSVLFYEEDGTLIDFKQNSGNGERQFSFITPKDIYYLVIEFYSSSVADGGGYIASSVTISDIQLESGNIGTEYEPYFITKDTKVVQKYEHTLTAIWEEKS